MTNPQSYGLTKSAYGVNDAVKQLGIGRTTIYALIKAGRLRATKVGGRTLFLANDLAAFLSDLQKECGR